MKHIYTDYNFRIFTIKMSNLNASKKRCAKIVCDLSILIILIPAGGLPSLIYNFL